MSRLTGILGQFAQLHRNLIKGINKPIKWWDYYDTHYWRIRDSLISTGMYDVDSDKALHKDTMKQLSRGYTLHKKDKKQSTKNLMHVMNGRVPMTPMDVFNTEHRAYALMNNVVNNSHYGIVVHPSE